MSALSDALNKANTQEWSTRTIADKTQGRLNHATVAKYLNGTHAARPDDATLKSLSDVFGIPLARLRELAGLQAGEPDPYVPPREAAQLSRRQRRAVDEVIRSMLDPIEKVGGEYAARRSASIAGAREPARLPPPRTREEVEAELAAVQGDLRDLAGLSKGLQDSQRPRLEQRLGELDAELRKITEWERSTTRRKGS